VDDRTKRTVVAGTAGAVLAALAVYALAAIPRAGEFHYRNPPGGNAFWPLPFAPLNGFSPQQFASHIVRALLLFPACALIGLALRGRSLRPHATRRAMWPIAIGATLTMVIALFVIRSVPLQDDDATYLMQAELLTRGLIADPAYPPSAAFDEPFTIFSRIGMSGMYLFGTPLVLAVGLPIGAPWIGQVLLVALTLWFAHRAAMRDSDQLVAWMGTLLLALSPMLTFTSATLLSQPAGLAGVAAAVHGARAGDWRGGLLVGTGVGFAFVARPQMAAPAGLALAALYGWRDRRMLAAAIIAGFPWLLAVAAYDQAITGNPWHLPRFLYTGELERYGFGTVLRNYSHTPLKAAALAVVVLVRFNGWALGWPISLLGPALWFAIGRPNRAMVAPWAAVGLATFLYQAGYPAIGTSETGAIYHHAALPFFAFSTAAALRDVASRSWGQWVQATALASVLLGTTSFYVEHAMRLSRLSAAIEGPRRSLKLQLPALLLEERWGGRPQEGWVFGIPFRERSPSSAIVRFPWTNNPTQLRELIARWSDRRCYYLSYDLTRSQYHVTPCDQIGAH
jgi:hypothetical protein